MLASCMNKLTYYRQKIQQLKAEASAQKQTIADLQQRLFMIEAELFAFETAADIRDPTGRSGSGPRCAWSRSP